MNIRQMNIQIKDLLEQAKTLSEDERILLADLLYAESSLSPEGWEAAWLGECERRLAEVENGKVKAENFDVKMARLRQKCQLK